MLGAGAGCWCGLWARGGDTAPVLGAGSARGRDSGRRCRCCELAVRVVETGCQCCVLAVRRVVETGSRVLGAGLGGRAGAQCWRPLLTVK